MEKREIRVIENDEDKLVLAWDKDEDVDEYDVYFSSGTFNCELYKKVKENYIEIKKKDAIYYSGVKVEYIKSDDIVNKDITVISTDFFYFYTLTDPKIDVHSMRSYKGITVSFRTKEIYDIFKLYKIENKNRKLITVSEDFQITSEELNEEDTYLVEA